ncbi:hypothetical protein HYW60_01000 [Candidatus Kaiserbacteria bacterium]|nr:hypothetical protein [Candidatus Kaiserbacteria bacterium]
MKSKLVGNTHVVSGGQETLTDVVEFLGSAGIETRGNPDVYVRAYKHFGIDEARELRERATLRPFGERRVFLIAAPGINREAQNALLKTLEEPPGNALFFFVLPNPGMLLPTFRSRVHLMERAIPMDLPSPTIAVSDFLKAPTQKRLDMLKPLLEKGEDDKRDLGAILSFLGSLESALAKNPEGLRTLYRARKYIADRGALVKPLLEQVALLVPRV